MHLGDMLMLIYICSHGELFRCFLLEYIGGSGKNRFLFYFFVFIFFCSWEGSTSADCWSDKEFISEPDLLANGRKLPLLLWRSDGSRWALCDFHTSLTILLRQIELQLSGTRNTPGLLKEFLIASTDHARRFLPYTPTSTFIKLNAFIKLNDQLFQCLDWVSRCAIRYAQG